MTLRTLMGGTVKDSQLGLNCETRRPTRFRCGRVQRVRIFANGPRPTTEWEIYTEERTVTSVSWVDGERVLGREWRRVEQ